MSCIHLGERAGSLISQCCGGKEKLVDLYYCGSPLVSAQLTVPTRGESGMAPTVIDSVRDVSNVMGCVRCPHSQAAQSAVAMQARPKTLARTMWEDMRRRREGRTNFSEPVIPSWDSLACVYRGDRVGGDIHVCHLKGQCSRTEPVEGMQRCDQCSERSPTIVYPASGWPQVESIPEPAITPMWRVRIPLKTHSIVLNNSIIEHRGRLYMAYRNGWGGANIRICELNDRYEVVRNEPLKIARSQWNSVGCEDPRLFVYRGKLHVAFTGVESQRGLIAHVMYARISDNFAVEQVFLPQFMSRNAWEKNWSFFEHEDRLYCEYSCRPRIILSVDDDKASIVHADPDGHQAIGTIRGGASPVFWRGEFYCFDHRVMKLGSESWYVIGVHTFESKPPFRLARSSELPLLIPDRNHRPQPHVPFVVYPCGAVLRNNQWVVSFGYFDHRCELAAFDVNEVEKLLSPVDQSVGDYRAELNEWMDWQIWREVYVANEYPLGDISAGHLVVDIGAHVGAFSRRAAERGATVVSVEVVEDRYRRLSINVPECEAIHGACVGASRRRVACPAGGEPLIPLDDIKPGRRIDLLKIDCEGDEYAILMDSDLGRVGRITGEAHLIQDGDKTWTMDDLTRHLTSQGFVVSSDKPGETWRFEARRIS